MTNLCLQLQIHTYNYKCTGTITNMYEHIQINNECN